MTLRDPDVRLHEVEICVLTPFRPMLGDRGTPNKVRSSLFNCTSSLQEIPFLFYVFFAYEFIVVVSFNFDSPM